MRELKFRAWLPAYNQMIYPDLCDFIRGNDSLVIGQIKPYFKYKMGLVIDAVFVHSNFDKNQMGEVNDWSDDIDYIIQQYTGLRDKNGREIYEGDIVLHRNSNKEVRIGEFWDGEDDRVGAYLQNPKITHRNFGTNKLNAFNMCKVIGNIFENPELLK